MIIVKGTLILIDTEKCINLTNSKQHLIQYWLPWFCPMAMPLCDCELPLSLPFTSSLLSNANCPCRWWHSLFLASPYQLPFSLYWSIWHLSFVLHEAFFYSLALHEAIAICTDAGLFFFFDRQRHGEETFRSRGLCHWFALCTLMGFVQYNSESLYITFT